PYTSRLSSVLLNRTRILPSSPVSLKASWISTYYALNIFHQPRRLQPTRCSMYYVRSSANGQLARRGVWTFSLHGYQRYSVATPMLSCCPRTPPLGDEIA